MRRRAGAQRVLKGYKSNIRWRYEVTKQFRGLRNSVTCTKGLALCENEYRNGGERERERE